MTQARYDKTQCRQCHGTPPVGFLCLLCLSVTPPDPKPQTVLKVFDEIALGDTRELDPAWDALMEHVVPSFALPMVGIEPVTISRLFRIAVDATKR